MKNILSKSEFKSLRYKLNVSMDMSNRTGFSDSLVGRAFNKLFSFGKTLTSNLVLNDLKSKLEDVYFKGILLTLANSNINANDIETVDLMVNVWFVKKEDKDEEVSIQERKLESWQTPKYDRKRFIFDLPKKDINIDDYTYRVIPNYSGVEVKREKNKVEKDSNFKDMTTISVSADGDTETYLLILKKDESQKVSDKQEEKTEQSTETQITAFNVGDKAFYEPENKSVTVLALPGHIEQKYLQGVLKDNKLEKDQVLIDKEHKEVIVNKDQLKLASHETGLSKVGVKNDENLEKIKAERIQKAEEVLNNAKNKFTDPVKIVHLNKALKVLDRFKTTASEKDWATFTGLLKSIDSSLVVNESKYYNFLFEQNVKELVKYLQIFEETGLSRVGETGVEKTDKNQVNNGVANKPNNGVVITNPTANKKEEPKVDSNIQDAQIIDETQPKTDTTNQSTNNESDDKKTQETSDNIDITVTKLDEKESENLFKRPTIKGIFKNYKLNENEKELLKAYGKIDLSKLDQKGIVKKFIDNADLRKKAITMVDKEAIKEIQLKAEWLYDTDKYEDKRNKIYSRINWTTTGPDMAKLKNTWLKKIANVKSIYTPFFADEAGNFPKELDPPALINSDKAFRTTFDQYSVSTVDNKSKFKNNINYLAKSENEELLVKFGFLSNKSPNANDYGVFRLIMNDRLVFIIYKHYEIDKKHMFKYLGFVDFSNLEKEMNKIGSNNINESKIKELIKKYNYTTENINEAKNSDGQDDKDIKEMFSSIRRSFIEIDGKKIALTEKNSVISFYRNQNIVSPDTAGILIPQIVLFKPENETNWEKSNTYVSKISDRTKVVGYTLLEDLKNVKDKKDFLFRLKINKAYSIPGGKSDSWLKEIDVDTIEIKNKMTSEIQTIANTFKSAIA